MDAHQRDGGSTVAWAALLGAWSDGDAPLNEQLAGAISGLVHRGDLRPGDRLPSERDLAEQLGISRTTVVSAYERLRTDGIIRSRRGSGSRIAPGVEPCDRHLVGRCGALVHARPAGRRGRHRCPANGIVPPGMDDPIALTIGALRGWSGVREVIETTVREDLDELLDDYGYLPFGLPALRAAVARMLSESGVPTSTDQILITGGGQQAIHLLVDQLAGADGVVAIEDPTYIGALDAIRAVGACTVPVPVGPDGIRIDILTRSLGSVSPAFLYVVPTFHNPTGAVMPDANRRALAELALRRDLIVVEDLAPGDDRQPADAATHRDLRARTRSITIGSLSKGGWGGLRIGWIRAQPRLITRLAARKATFDHGSATLTQGIAVRMLERGDEFGERAERESRLRREVAAAALREYLPDWRWTMPQGGLSFWVMLPDGDAVTLLPCRGRARRAGPAGSRRLTPGWLPRPPAHRRRRGAGAAPGGHPQARPRVAGMQPGRGRQMDSVLSVSV